MNFKVLIEHYKNLSDPIKATLWYTIANILLKGIALLSTPIFTRILTEEQYGSFALFQSWYSILIIVTTLNMFLSSYTKGLITFKDDQDGFTSSLLTLTTLNTLCFIIIYLLSPKFWNDLFGLSTILMMAMFIELITMPAIEFWSAKQRFDYKYKKYLFVSIMSTFLSLSLGVVAVLLSYFKLEARVYSDVFSKFIFGIFLFFIIMKKGKTFLNIKYWKFALVFNIPLIPHYLSTYVLSQSDRIMIGKIVGSSEAAYYSVAYTISTMMTLITTAINNSLIPYIYKSIDSNQIRKINNATSPLFMLVGLFSILTMLFAPEIIMIFAGQKYMDAIYIIPPVAASIYFMFLYAMFSTIEYYYQKTKYISFATMVCAILNIILNFIFIKLFGYYAAGYTTLICYIGLSIIHYIFYNKVIKEEMNVNVKIYNIKVIIMMSIIIITVMLLMLFVYQWSFIRYLLLLVILVFVILNRKFIIAIFGQIKKK